MAPVLHCIRHAQGFHNLSTANHSMPDPLLTPLGETQCKELSEAFPHHSNISHILASPLRRTLYTAIYSLEPAVSSKKLTVLALPEIQETSDVPCDTGSDAIPLKKEVAQKKLPVDLSLVKEGWNDKRIGTRWAPTSMAISTRAKEARRFMRDLAKKMVETGEEGDIVMVSHGGFLHYFTEDWEDSGVYNAILSNTPELIDWGTPGTGWANTEYRSYSFKTLEEPTTANGDHSSRAVDGSISHDKLVAFENDYENGTLVETPESRRRRGKVEVTPTREQQIKFFDLAMSGWEDQGLQNPSKMGDGEVIVDERR